MGDCTKYHQLQKSPKVKEIEAVEKNKTILNAYINRADLTKINKVWFYLVNSVAPSDLTVGPDLGTWMAKSIYL